MNRFDPLLDVAQAGAADCHDDTRRFLSRLLVGRSDADSQATATQGKI